MAKEDEATLSKWIEVNEILVLGSLSTFLIFGRRTRKGAHRCIQGSGHLNLDKGTFPEKQNYWVVYLDGTVCSYSLRKG